MAHNENNELKDDLHSADVELKSLLVIPKEESEKIRNELATFIDSDNICDIILSFMTGNQLIDCKAYYPHRHSALDKLDFTDFIGRITFFEKEKIDLPKGDECFKKSELYYYEERVFRDIDAGACTDHWAFGKLYIGNSEDKIYFYLRGQTVMGLFGCDSVTVCNDFRLQEFIWRKINRDQREEIVRMQRRARKK